MSKEPAFCKRHGGDLLLCQKCEDEYESRRAQPAAPAEQSRGLLTCAGCGSPDWPLHEDGCPIRHAEVNRVWNSPMTGFRGGRCLAAAPSVVPEPLFLLHSGQIDSGGEQDDWETEADSQVRVDEFCRLHPGQTIPLFAHPPRAPLTDEHVYAVVRSVQPHLATTSKAWRDLVVECRYWLEAAHGIGGK